MDELYQATNHSSTVTYTETETYHRNHNLIPFPLTVVFAVIVSLGLIGNIAVICVILIVKKLRTTHNIFVINLCIADLLLAINAAFAIVEDFHPAWKLEPGACRLFGFMSFAPPLGAVLSMVIIARNRYKAITGAALVVSLPGRFSSRRVVLCLLFIWLVTFLITMPILFGWVKAKAGFFCACCFYFSDNLPYGISVTAVMYVIPNIAIAFCYIRIIVHVKQHASKVRPAGALTSGQFHERNRKREMRVTAQFVFLFLVFNFCYAPSMIVFWIDSDEVLFPIAAHHVVKAIFLMNLVANPLIYFVFNSTAIQAVKDTCCKQPGARAGDGQASTNSPMRLTSVTGR